MREATFYTDPQVQYLSQVLDEIHKGRIVIPRFQRPLVWEWDQRLELLRSIRDGIPMGAIMIWRTMNETVRSYDRLGPFLVGKPQPNTPRQYLLDGVQRLSTLYGALFSPAVEHSGTVGEDENFAVFYDLITEDFLSVRDLASAVGDGHELKRFLPLSLVLDSVALIKFQRAMPPNDQDLWVERSDQIAGAFRNYKVPVIPITTDNLDLATKTFQKINSQGERMNEAHMLQALTWQNDFDLRETLASLKSQMLEDIGWSSLDDEEILRVCKMASALDIYEANADELSQTIRKHPQILDDGVRNIRRAAVFLRDSCFVPAPALLPYSLQLTLLADAFRQEPEPSPDVSAALRSWFWLSTYGELFRGMSGYRLQQATSDMRTTLRSRAPVWSGYKNYERQPLKSTFDFRAARAKALALLLVQHHDRVLGVREANETVRDFGKAAIPQLFVSSKAAPISNVGSPGNRIICHPQKLAGLKEELLSGKADQALLERHLIPDQAYEALLARDFESFVKIRFVGMADLEKRFMSSIELQLGADSFK